MALNENYSFGTILEDNEEVKNMTPLENAQDYPHCSMGMVTGKFGENSFHGSGCLISSKIVLTCAHNLYNRGSETEAK